jgi:ribosomal protein S18 acetylase RimI-like enzyme
MIVRTRSLIHYRTFRNSDPPALVDIWRARAQERGLILPMSTALFDQLVLSKPYFENAGLILALDDDQPVGFVHAGFGPNEDQSALSMEHGVTCMLIVRPDHRRMGIGQELLSRSEAYLRSRGAKVLYAGGIRPHNPFYLGLYGGSELPGVLDSDADAQRRYRASGYEEVDRTRLFHRELAGFRPPVDRQQMQIRRQKCVQVIADPPTATWWEACTLGVFDRMRFELTSRDTAQPIASATMWSMEPISTSLGVRSAGLYDVQVAPSERGRGHAVFLLSEAFRQLQTEGVSRVEAQAMHDDETVARLLGKLGFQQVDQGVVFRKE